MATLTHEFPRKQPGEAPHLWRDGIVGTMDAWCKEMRAADFDHCGLVAIVHPHLRVLHIQWDMAYYTRHNADIDLKDEPIPKR